MTETNCIVLAMVHIWCVQLATDKVKFRMYFTTHVDVTLGVLFPTEAERNVSYKNLLQEYLQKSHSTSLPSYRTERETEGYISCVSIKLPPQGTSRTFRGKPHANKKAAEQESAKKACLELGIVKQ